MKNLPRGWSSSSIDELFVLKYGKGLRTKELTAKGFPVFGANGIIGNYHSYLYDKEKLIISCRGAASGTVHFTFPQSFVTSNSIVFTRKNAKLISKKFAYFYLKGISKEEVVTGTAQPQITIHNLKKLLVLLPPIDEQEEIVRRIEITTAHFRKTQTSLTRLPALLADFREAVLNSIFDEVIANEGSLSSPFDFVTSGSRGWAKYYSTEGQLFIRITNLNRRTVSIDLREEKMKYVDLPIGSEGKRTRLEEGDILVSITADLGLIGVVSKSLAEKEAYINQHVALARPKKEFISKYVGYFLVATNHGQRKFDQEGKGATKSGLRLDDVRSVHIPVIPIEEQQEIVNRIESLFALADRIEVRMETLKGQVEDLPQAILAKAFRGEL